MYIDDCFKALGQACHLSQLGWDAIGAFENRDKVDCEKPLVSRVPKIQEFGPEKYNF